MIVELFDALLVCPQTDVTVAYTSEFEIINVTFITGGEYSSYPATVPYTQYSTGAYSDPAAWPMRYGSGGLISKSLFNALSTFCQ